MKSRSLLPIIVLALMCSGFTARRAWVVDPGSRLTIQGFTNVNKFLCAVEYYPGNDTLHFAEQASAEKLLFTHSVMTIPVRNFDCGARAISKDFQATLKSDDYPTMSVAFISLQYVEHQGKGCAVGVMDITIAGVTTRYTVAYQSSVTSNGCLRLTGVHTVNFSDFRLSAPEKFRGLVKVREGLKVYFNLVLKEISV
jgi:hypothetical protein